MIILSVDSSFNIKDRLLKFSVVIIDMLVAGTVSQIFNLDPALYFVNFQK